MVPVFATAVITFQSSYKVTSNDVPEVRTYRGAARVKPTEPAGGRYRHMSSPTVLRLSPRLRVLHFYEKGVRLLRQGCNRRCTGGKNADLVLPDAARRAFVLRYGIHSVAKIANRNWRLRPYAAP